MIYTPEELAEMAAADAEIEREYRDKIAAKQREYRRRKKLEAEGDA